MLGGALTIIGLIIVASAAMEVLLRRLPERGYGPSIGIGLAQMPAPRHEPETLGKLRELGL
jgi:hypothetical protein